MDTISQRTSPRHWCCNVRSFRDWDVTEASYIACHNCRFGSGLGVFISHGCYSVERLIMTKSKKNVKLQVLVRTFNFAISITEWVEIHH